MGVAEPSTKANSNLKPEIIKYYCRCADIRFFDNRLEFDIYILQQTFAYNQISIHAFIRHSSGYSAYWIPGSVYTTRRWELQMNATPVSTRLELEYFNNFAKNSSEVINLEDGDPLH